MSQVEREYHLTVTKELAVLYSAQLSVSVTPNFAGSGPGVRDRPLTTYNLAAALQAQ